MKNKIKKFLGSVSILIVISYTNFASAGIVEDTIKKHNLDINKSEDRCKLSDYLIKEVNLSYSKYKKENFFSKFAICFGEKYDVVEGRVIVGRGKKTSYRAECHGMDEEYVFMFKSPNKSDKRVLVSRGFDGKYIIPANYDFSGADYNGDELNKMEGISEAFVRADKSKSFLVELRKTNYTAEELKIENDRIESFNKINNRNQKMKKIDEKIDYFNKVERAAIVTERKPKEKIPFYYIKNCDVIIEQKLTNKINQ